MLDDAVSSMVDSLLGSDGVECEYIREGAVLGTMTLSIRKQPSQVIDNGQGGLIEILPVDAIGKAADLPSGEPKRGDRIKAGETTYEVLPTVSEKVFRKISDSMIRIHMKQVATT